MTTIYSDTFIEQARVKVLSRGSRTIAMVAQDLNVNSHTLRGWMVKRLKGKQQSPEVLIATNKHDQQWSLAQQLEALHLTHGLDEVRLGAWCRERGLFVHQLEEWRATFLAGPSAPVAGVSDGIEMRLLKDQNNQLKREILRKDKALAEAGALLVLQKKFRALWDDEANS